MSGGGEVLEVGVLTIRPHAAAGFEAAFAEAAEILKSCDGCLGVALSRGVESPDCYQVHVRWRSVADHEQGYGRSPRRDQVRGLIAPFVIAALPVEHYRPVL